MAYGNPYIYSNPNYNGMQMPLNNMSNNIVCAYVPSEQAANSYPLGPNQFGVFIDTDKPIIYTKKTDQFGRPQPMQILDYTVRGQNNVENNSSDNFVTKDDLNKFKDEIKEIVKSSKQNNNYKKVNREEQ